MPITRRTFMVNGLRLVSVGMMLPAQLLDASQVLAGDTAPHATGANLLSQGAILGGSSFFGKVNHSTVTIDTVNYYPEIADGNAATGWMPMEAKGPHWLEMCWRYPVEIDALDMSSRNVNSAQVYAWQNNTFAKLADLKGDNSHAQFAKIQTQKLRIELTEFTEKPVINELVIQGPPQITVPASFPKEISTDEKFTVKNIQINSRSFKPGDVIQLSCEASSAATLKEDCVFIVEMREKAPNDYFREQFGDYEIGGVVVQPVMPTSQWALDQPQVITANIELPYYAPSGETAVSIIALTADGKLFIPVENSQTGDNQLAKITIGRDEISQPVEEFPLTQLADNNGQRGFQIGSKFEMPFLNRYMATSDFERFYDSKANGIEIQYFLMYSSCIRPHDQWQDFLTRLDQQITSMLRVRPESYFMIGMDLRVTRDWLRANPDERMLDRNGEVILEKISPEGLVSYGSQKYLQECYDFIDLVINFVNTKPYAGRIIGYYPYACSQNDAFIGGVQNNLMVKDRDKIFIGDFHPGVIQLFREWLKQKYGSADRLQEVWQDKKVTFENALPDGMALAAEDVPSGVFRDPVKSRAAIDYITFFPTLIGGLYQKLAAHYKMRTNRKALVFMNYGAVLATLPTMQPSGARSHVNNNDFHHLLEDENIDMFVQSMPYNLRNADDPIVVYQPIESINVNKKMYLADYDARTISCGTLKYGRHRSQYESKAIIQRDFAWLMIKNAGAWLADMSVAGWRDWIEYRKPWFSTPETTKPTREVLELFAKSAAIPKKSVSEIAVVVDIDTPAYEDTLNAGVIYRGLITNMVRGELTKLGAPYDILLKSDLANGNLRDDYKLYIFVNPFHLTDGERAQIEKLKRDGKTLLWFYAPGYAGDKGLDVNGVSQLTGFDIHIKPDVKELLQMEVSAKNNTPLTAGLAGTSFKADIVSNIKEIHPEVIQPVFYVDDPQAQVLAKYPDGKTAWAAKDFGGWKSIYSAVPYLNVQAIRNIAKYAGVHLYCEEDIVMAADNRFLMFTNGYETPRSITVKLPAIRIVKDAFSGDIVSAGKQNFVLKMETPDTRILTME